MSLGVSALVSASRWCCGRLHWWLLLIQRKARRPSRYRRVLGPQPPTVRKQTHTHTHAVVDCSLQQTDELNTLTAALWQKRGWAAAGKTNQPASGNTGTSHHSSLVLKVSRQEVFDIKGTIWILLQTERTLKLTHDLSFLVLKDVVE